MQRRQHRPTFQKGALNIHGGYWCKPSLVLQVLVDSDYDHCAPEDDIIVQLLVHANHRSLNEIPQNVEIKWQRTNSVAWLELPQPAENCGPYSSPLWYCLQSQPMGLIKPCPSLTRWDCLPLISILHFYGLAHASDACTYK